MNASTSETEASLFGNTVPEWQQWVEKGIRAREIGDLNNALEAYRQAVSAPDASAQANFNLGNTLFAMGRIAEARDAFIKSLQTEATMLPAQLQLARCYRALGDPAMARRAYVAVLQQDSEHFSAWLEAGHVSRELADYSHMLAAYERATQVSPQRFEPWLALARSHEELGQVDRGAAALHRALTLAVHASQPHTVVRLHSRMARYRLERGEYARALDAIRLALMTLRVEAAGATDVNAQAELQIDMGEILMRLGLDADAHRLFERASAATSEATLTRLAELSFRFNLWQEALEVLCRNAKLHPDSAAAHWNLAHLCVECWQLEEAFEHLAAAERIAPQPGALSLRASVAGRQGDVDTALRLYLQLARLESGRTPMASSAAMSSLYSDKLSASGIRELHRQLFESWGQGARAPESFANPREPQRTLRVGLLSADFHHQHPVNIFMQPVLARLDPQQVQITVYFTGATHDEQTRLAKSRVTQWVECTTLNDRQLAARIEADNIDILLDLAGHTSHNRMAMMSQRAAPVQATFLGYPGSTGVPNIDWILADATVAPDTSDELFSELVYRLPHTVFCFSPEVDYHYPSRRTSDRPLTFGSFNNTPKLTPHTVTLWSRVLQSVPSSRLVLKAPSFKDAGAIDIFKRRFADEGVAVDRIDFRGPVGLSEMMAEYADIDIALDPVPYNGGTTSLQAMWMGVPVLTLAGHSFVSRMGASFMSAADMSEWIATSDDEYVAIAVRMAADRERLASIQQGLRQHLLQRPAWDIDRYSADFQDALRHMWVCHCGGKSHGSVAIREPNRLAPDLWG